MKTSSRARSTSLAVLGIALLCALGGIAISPVPATAQQNPVTETTLVPPTLFPTPIPSPTAAPSGVSGLAKIRGDEKAKPHLTIGVLFNAYPFTSLSTNGELVGFEADIGRALAQDWGIPTGGDNPPIFKQVTRQNGLSMLLNGDIDLLMGQVIHTRELDSKLDFSDSYFVNREVALAMSDSPLTTITELADKTVGVVIGSAAEPAVAAWQKEAGKSVTVKHFAMFDDAVDALASKQIDALVDDRWNLDARVRGGKIEGVKLLDGAFREEPYAIAMRSHDSSLRMLVNRTLQRLAKSDLLGQIYGQWFPVSILPGEQRTIPFIWNGLDDDKRGLEDFPTDLPVPDQSVTDRMSSQKVIRVAGLGAPDATGKLSALDSFGQALVNEMARRWGVTVQFVPGAPGSAEQAVASGTADLALGLEPHWGTQDQPDRVDFTSVYAIHGYRLLVASARNIGGFGDLLFGNGKNLGIFAEDESAFPIAEDIAKTAGVLGLRKILIRNDSEISQYMADGTMSAVFGDSLRLVPIAGSTASFTKLLDKEYTREPISFAVPRGDSSFRSLVEFTMQDMARDGTFQRIWKEQFGIGDPLPVLYYP